MNGLQTQANLLWLPLQPSLTYFAYSHPPDGPKSLWQDLLGRVLSKWLILYDELMILSKLHRHIQVSCSCMWITAEMIISWQLTTNNILWLFLFLKCEDFLGFGRTKLVIGICLFQLLEIVILQISDIVVSCSPTVVYARPVPPLLQM